MPKEVIVSNVATGEPFAVNVCWSHDTSVQVATLKPDGESKTGSSGWFVDLERDHINRLIKVLRKARDQAYGVDE